VLGFSVNFFGGRHYSPWYGWTAVPHHHFRRAHFNVARVAPVHIDRRLHSSFVVRDRAPEARYAVSRSDVAIRSTGRFAVPRSGVGVLATDGSSAGRAGSASSSSPERRFPGPARSPRTPSVEAQTAPGRPGVSGARAVSRERSPGTAVDGSVRSTREYRRNPGAGTGGSIDGGSPVTAAPSGAVRAVPRIRQQEATPAEPRQASPEATSARPEAGASAPAPSYRQAPARPRSGAPVDVYRSPRSRESGTSEFAYPGYRRTPDAGAEYRSRSVPRTTAPEAPSNPRGIERQAPAHRRVPDAGGPSPRYEAPRMPRSDAPSYRSMPERRAPSESRPSAEPSQGPPRGGGAPDGGGSRSRSGGASGQARRRG
jgi:hypothetical protein